MQKVVVTASEFRFLPAEFKLSAGVPTQLTLVNEGSVEHDITVTGLSVGGQVATQEHSPGAQGHTTRPTASGTVHVVAPKQQRATVSFTPKAGTYEFVCVIPGHLDAGMKGTLLVE
ncbi:MAG: nitrite reductase, copper-containing [Dehalococcoidia bacterium]|nr:nitrite reductase, copper-containing [Dehalococcoidia bacterium]